MMSWIGFSELGSRNCSRKREALVGLVLVEELRGGMSGSVMKDWAFWRRFESVNMIGLRRPSWCISRSYRFEWRPRLVRMNLSSEDNT